MRGLVVLILLCSLIGSATSAADTTAAVVTGAELLYVRRGPGVGFPAFATIERGERIEVERLEGVWALVRLPSGQSGYVHSTFLSFPGETRATIIVPATATPSPTHPSEPAATQEEPTSGATVAPPTRGDGGLVGAPTSGATPAASDEGAAAPAAGDDIAALRGDVRRLTIAVDALQRRIGESPLGPEGTADHVWHPATIAVLIVLALFAGWAAGVAYGRQSERSRRSRIRF